MDTVKDIRAGKKYERLADASGYNEGIRESWLPFWVRNTAENYSNIKERFREENCDVSVERKNDEGRNCLIVGSGPSLNDWEPYFKDWEGAILISSSHLAFFEAIGVKPTYCFIIDADPSMIHLVSEADTKGITLITHSQMDPNVLAHWDGPVRFFRMQDPGDEFFSKYVPMMYSDFRDDAKPDVVWPGIKCFVLNSGCVANTMIALSTFLGFKNLFLCGVDFGFPNDQYRFNGYKRTEDGFEPDPDTGIPKERALKDGHNGIKTDQVSCFYKYSTHILWGMDGPNLYSCSRGILTEIPYISPKDVLACQGDVAEKYVLTHDQKYAQAQEYLRHRGVYIIRSKGRTHKKPTKSLMRSKKRLMKYMVFTNWVKKNFRWLWKDLGKPTEKVKRGLLLFWPLLMLMSLLRIDRVYRPLTRNEMRGIIHAMWGAEMVKFRLKYWEWTIGAEETVRAFLGYSAITNLSGEKGLGKVKLYLKFNLGRLLGVW